MKKILFKVLCLFVAGVFSFELMCDPQWAQAQMVNLPAASASLALSAEYTPLMVRGMKINPQDGLDLSFIVDTGNTDLNEETLKIESEKLIKYFLTALAVPEQDLWVNLSPYEKDRITSDALSHTEMGKDLLAQDYILKKITSSLLFPEDENGKKFWEKVYSRMYEGQGMTDIPVDTFHKIWIMPESAEVFAQNDTVLILNSKLKVMLEEDYLAKAENEKLNALGVIARSPKGDEAISEIASQKTLAMTDDVKKALREVILPIIENEVNHGENFAALRQIFHGLILAKWFKDNLKTSLLGQVYADQSKLEGISTAEQKNIESIYNQYLAAFQAGSEGFIKEDYDPATQSMIAKKYITGGFKMGEKFVHNAMLTSLKGFEISGMLQLVKSKISMKTRSVEDQAMMAKGQQSGLQRLNARKLKLELRLRVVNFQINRLDRRVAPLALKRSQARWGSSEFYDLTNKENKLSAQLNELYAAANLINERLQVIQSEMTELFNKKMLPGGTKNKAMMAQTKKSHLVSLEALEVKIKDLEKKTKLAMGWYEVFMVANLLGQSFFALSIEGWGALVNWISAIFSAAYLFGVFLTKSNVDTQELRRLRYYRSHWEEITNDFRDVRAHEKFLGWVQAHFKDMNDPLKQRLESKDFKSISIEEADHIIHDFRKWLAAFPTDHAGRLGIQDLEQSIPDARWRLDETGIQRVIDAGLPLVFLSLEEHVIGYAVRLPEALLDRIDDHVDFFGDKKDKDIRIVFLPEYREDQDLRSKLLEAFKEKEAELQLPPHPQFAKRFDLIELKRSGKNQAMMTHSMAKFLAVASLFAASFFVSPVAGFAQTFPQTYSPEIPYINRNSHIQQYIRTSIGRPLTDYERLFIGHLVFDYVGYFFGEKMNFYKLNGKGIFNDTDIKPIMDPWIDIDSAGGHFGYKIIPRSGIGRDIGRVVLPLISEPRAEAGRGEEYGDLADVTKGGIDLDTKDMSFTSTGAVDQAILQQLPNIRPQDIIGISITNITISPIPSLPKLLGMDDSESEKPEESLAKMELSYLKEE